MMDQDEFAGRIFEIVDRIEKVYLFEQITDQLLMRLKTEFVLLFNQFDHPDRVEVQVSIDRDNPMGVKINFYQGDGGPMLKEIEQMYNCLVYDSPSGLRCL
jgi:hypothetical protein